MRTDELTDVVWIKSSRSGVNGNCVEVAFLGEGRVALRDSKDPQGPVLRFTRGEWSAFVDGVSEGELRNP
ncbi:DUF397 domain-containing protein [Kineosporia sp. NBRC 101731]|uniref:DUF397 domain-containing protein n=1 Tax=Kineosporia sp. NBRC 101731 TaxID=3032199 RepID=UPI00249FCF5E|nr:DUF397 domain-containing protein [Kineosporia sp. NBRC 101731]GLY31148.1 transcriptional regulator [Kineosporia sp. NBRC 101731]